MRAYGRIKIRAPLILNLRTRWSIVELKALVVVTLCKSHQYPLNGRQDVMQKVLDMFWKTNTLFPPTENVITLPLSFSLQPGHCYRNRRKLFYIMLIKYLTIFMLYVAECLEPSNTVSLTLFVYCFCCGKINENCYLYL
jgi:hypothetical protein